MKNIICCAHKLFRTDKEKYFKMLERKCFKMQNETFETFLFYSCTNLSWIREKSLHSNEMKENKNFNIKMYAKNAHLSPRLKK